VDLVVINFHCKFLSCQKSSSNAGDSICWSVKDKFVFCTMYRTRGTWNVWLNLMITNLTLASTNFYKLNFFTWNILLRNYKKGLPMLKFLLCYIHISFREENMYSFIGFITSVFFSYIRRQHRSNKFFTNNSIMWKFCRILLRSRRTSTLSFMLKRLLQVKKFFQSI
jgi:hypothetical protein